MNKKIAYCTTIAVLLFGIGSSFGQTVSDEAKRYNTRGVAAVEMAKSPSDYELAIKEFSQAAALAPDWPDVYYNLGLVQEKAEKYNDAVTSFKQYIRLAPNSNDAETVKTLIYKLEYKRDQEEGVKRVYEMMTSDSYEMKQIGDLKESKDQYLSAYSFGRLLEFRIVSGKMQASNNGYYDPEHTEYHPELHPPTIKWNPVKVNGRFYEYAHSMYIDVSSGYVHRVDSEVKGEIISIDPPRVKEIIKSSVTWGAPIPPPPPGPWDGSGNLEATAEWVYELIAKGKTPIAKGADINAKDESGYTPLHNAIMGGRKDKAELLIAKGADINAKDRGGCTPLYWAALGGQKEVAELLIAKGADVNAKDEYGVTPLHIATMSGQKEMVELLIAKGADINAKDELWGHTPLHGAVKRGRYSIAELLIAKGADINAKDKDGKTPLRYAEIKNQKDMAELLKKHGAR